MPDYAVLVPQAESVGALAVIRSLGSAGYVVHAVSTDPLGLGLKSRQAHRAEVSPAYQSEGYVEWVRDYLRANDIQAIIPSEGFLIALGEARSELLPLFPFAPDERSLMSAMSKHDLLTALVARHPLNLPPTLLIDNLSEVPAEPRLRELGAPLYVKLDGCHSLDGSGGVTRRFESADEARAYLLSLRGRFTRAVVQGHVEGQGVGAFFLCTGGEIRAEFMHHRLHEVPWTGGVSSLRESWWHEGVLADARAKLLLTGFEGVAMMEYRWDPATDRFAFIEMNARFWGSLHLALHAGVDFPRLLLDAWRGLPVSPARAKPGVRSRHLPLEIQHVWSRLRAPDVPARAKLAALVALAADTVDPRVRSDLFWPGDRGVFFTAMADFLRSLRSARQARGPMPVVPAVP